jgi:2'-5' RNA ligase
MQPLHYAVVAYVRNSVGRFVEELRREVYPEHSHSPAHVSILPPRLITGSEAAALGTLEELCSGFQPFDIALGDVDTFVPITPTVHIQVKEGAEQMRRLHDHLNRGSLEFLEPWAYWPHLTIVKLAADAEARAAEALSRERWSRYRGPRTIRLDELTFVREGPHNRWVDLAPVHLGRQLTRRR